MSTSLLLACFWVLIGVATAMLPIRKQMIPGSFLLLSAPVLLAYIGYQHGWIFFALGLAAFISMMRNPIKYLWARAKGEKPELPK